MQVFVSHSTHEDGPFANRLASDLESLGVETWIAPKSIPPGEYWAQAIERGIHTSEISLLVMTPTSLGSDWLQKEVELARSRREAGKCGIIPLHVAPTGNITEFISSIQFVPFLNDYGRGLSILGDRLGLDREAVENVAFYTAPDVPTWLVEPRPPEMVATLGNLQQGLDDTIPPKRDLRSLLFIAEILSRFDVVVLQQVRRNSSAMEQWIAAMNQYHDRCPKNL